VLVKIFLWQAIINGTSSESGFAKSQVITYFILVFIVSQVTDIVLEYATKIRTGTLSNDLIKPINPVGQELTRVLASKAIVLVKFIPVSISLIIIYHNYFIFPHINAWSILFLIMGFFIAFNIQLAIHNLAFWMTDVSALNYILVTIFNVFTGSLIPYDFLPKFVKDIFELLPFKFYVHAPVSALMRQLDANQIYNYILLGLAYAALLSLFNYILFKSGIKKYTAMGG